MRDVHMEPLRPAYGREEFEREVLEYSSALKGFARSLTGNSSAADDLVQETFIKALMSWESFTPGTHMKAWLFTIMRNTFTSGKRVSWRNIPLDYDLAARTIPNRGRDQSEIEEWTQEFAAIAPLLGFLPGDMRDAVVAVHYLGMQYTEACEVLQTEVGTIKSRVSRGLETIRDHMHQLKNHPFDLSNWATATEGVHPNHPYFQVAKAYEDIYKAIALRPAQSLVREIPIPVQTKKKKSDLDAAWEDLIASGSLTHAEDLEGLMR